MRQAAGEALRAAPGASTATNTQPRKAAGARQSTPLRACSVQRCSRMKGAAYRVRRGPALVAIAEPAKLLLAGGIPAVEEELAQVRHEVERVHLHTDGGCGERGEAAQMKTLGYDAVAPASAPAKPRNRIGTAGCPGSATAGPMIERAALWKQYETFKSATAPGRSRAPAAARSGPAVACGDAANTHVHTSSRTLRFCGASRRWSSLRAVGVRVYESDDAKDHLERRDEEQTSAAHRSRRPRQGSA